MATNDFLPFGTGAGANVLAQADYVALSARIAGFQSGTAKSIQLNKVWRQSAFISSVIAQYISDTLAVDVLDDGNASGLLTKLKAAIAATNGGSMLVTEEKAAGVAAGASVAGTFSVRALNTVRSNTIQGASLSSPQLTLPAGTYRISASAPANGVNLHAVRLYNVSDSATAILGTSENTTSFAATPGETTVTRSFVQGRLVLTAQKVFELRHFCQETVSSGLGSPANAGGNEVYAMIEIIKEA